jgi:hypothetical protein
MDDFNRRLLELLRQRRELDLTIAKLFGESAEGIRFSEKKFVGDLGEYYFSQNPPRFLTITQSLMSNNDYDFDGKLTEEGVAIFGLPSESVRIEVKTRHAQKGNNHLFQIHPEKFDLLAFVALADELLLPPHRHD